MLYRAWTFTASTTEPQELTQSELPIKPLGDHELLIENHAIALNPVDWKIIRAGFLADSTVQVAGVDGAGVVVAAGRLAKTEIGSRVAYHQSIRSNGSYGEKAIVDSRLCWPVPAHIHFKDAVAMLCPGLTALQSLQKLPQLQQQYVAVHGAGTLVGALLVQLLAAGGAKVIAIASGKHRDELLGLGAYGVVDYQQQQVVTDVQALLGEHKITALFDCVEASKVAEFYPLLDVNSHVLTIQGRVSENPFPAFDKAISLHEIALNTLHRYPSAWQLAALQTGFARLLQQGLSIVQGRIETISFDEIPQALQRLKQGQFGKFVAVLKEE
ncbi:MAG: zinc-binding dehydrogenase [Enterovibrio sp.]